MATSPMASNPFDQFDAQPAQDVLGQAKKAYPYLANSGLVGISGQDGGTRKLEYWPRGEPGNAQYPRPSGIPMNSVGVELFDKNVSPKDILADYVSHEAVTSDPKLQALYQEFAATVPEETMRKRYEYHKANLGEQRDFETWKERSGMPEYFRGYTFDQWPDARRFYSPQQLQKLDQVRQYLGVSSADGAPTGNPFDQFDAGSSAAPADARPTGDMLDAVIEPVMSLGSSAIATPVAGWAGIGAAGLRGLGLTDAFPGDVVERVQGALTYQPRTKAGAVTTGAISYPFEKLAQGADWLGQQASDATGMPSIGAAVNTATQMLAPIGVAKGLKAAKVRADGNRSTSRVDTPVATGEVAQAAPAATTAQRPAGLESVRPTDAEYVAPDLVLEQSAKPVQNKPAQQPVDPKVEARAKEYVGSIGVDWAALPREIQATLTEVAKDARGFEGLDNAAIARQLQLQSLPKPIPATRGQITRDPVQLRNEGNVSATKAGEPIREIYLDQNQAILENLEILKGRVANKQKPAETPEQVGLSVQDQALREKLKLSKANVSAKYKAAEEAGELQGKVSPARLIKTIRNSPDVSHFGWVETWLNQNKVIQKTDSGTITNKLSLKQMEDLRQAAVARAMDGGTEGFYAGKLIQAIDATTEGAGGKLYKEARAARRAQAMEFEETGAIARLVENKSRTDRATALEDTWRKTVIGGSIQDLRSVKRSLLTGGDRKTRSAGKRAWRDIKAQTIQHIQNEATKSVALNERGQANVTPAAMKRAIDSIGKEKLDEIFGFGTSAQMYRLLEATRTVKTVPPAGHQGSSTASNVLALLERGLGRVPVVGDVATGTIRAGVQLKQMGEAGRISRQAQRSPLQDAEETARKRNKLADY